VYQNWKPDMPSLQRDVDEQEERNQMLERRKEKAKEKERSVETHQRGALLKALPNDGKSIQRKKEGTKMKKRDPEAQGGAFERRKMHEEGAGLFVAPMMPEKANREVAKTTRKSAGKGWFDLPAAEYTPELKRDMRTLKLRGAFDPKRFYKNADTRKLPTHFSIGTVVEAAQDFHSARRTKRLKKRERLGSPRSKTKRKVPEEIRGKATLIATLVVGRSKVVLLEPFVFVIIRTRDICIFSGNSQTDNLFSSSSLFIITSLALLLSTTYCF
jgi:hypothetical protein